MSTETVIYIVLSGILALFIALFQYKYKSRSKATLNNVFAFLRFLTIFSLLLLIVNPKLEQIQTYVEKPTLILAVDDSKSIKHLNQDNNVKDLYESLFNNDGLKNKFNISSFAVGNQIRTLDSLNFGALQTNIASSLDQLKNIYKGTVAPTVLISDGNQTYGNSYEFMGVKYGQPIYPIIAGDTTEYVDLRIQQLNVNRYAYLKNKFPIEIITRYNGGAIVNTKLEIKSGNTIIHSQPIAFSSTDNSRILTLTLPANVVGTNVYQARLLPIENEKNVINNIKNFAIEVIDQQTKIAIVSDMLHPDLGAFKKSIERNEQRSADIIRPDEAIGKINDFQLFILYQPNNKFKILIDQLKTENKNTFIISGTKTDLNFLADTYKINQEATGQTEDYQTKLNPNYTPFFVDDIDFESFPPLRSNFGTVQRSDSYQTILFKRLGDVVLDEPLLVTYENASERHAVLFGEDIWRWRAQSFLDRQSFNDFDNFMNKLVQYLASNKQRKRLNVDYESFYDGNNGIILKAQFFDKNYAFDTRESLSISLTDNSTGGKKTFPLVLKNNNYQVDLSGLPASKYDFTVSTSNEKMSQSGNFEILEYDVEKQFLNADVTKLEQLATNSQGKSYFISDGSEQLIKQLLEDERFLPIQKSNKNIIPLIDWKWLLLLIVLSLSAEWFLRKYNGLI